MIEFLGLYLVTLGVTSGLLVLIYILTLVYICRGRIYKLILLIVLLLLLNNLAFIGLCFSNY